MVLAFGLFFNLSNGQDIQEGFNATGWGGSYGNHTTNGWTITGALRETTGTNRYEGAAAVRFNTSGARSIVSPSKNGGVGTLSLFHKKWAANDGNVTFSVFKSVDGTNWGNALTTFVSNSVTYSEFTFEINDANAKFVKIEVTSGQRALIDLVTITGFAASQIPPVVTPETVAGTYNVSLSHQIVASESPTSYNVSGTLPTGITLDTATGIFSGTPTQTGNFTVQVTATNNIGTSSAAQIDFNIQKANQTVTIANQSVVLGASSTNLPAATNEGIALSYSSSNTNVATITGTSVTYGQIGTAIITASAPENQFYNSFTSTFNIEVLDPNAVPCFEENFAGVSGNNTSTGGSSTLWGGNANFPNAGNSVAYQAGDAIRLGSGSSSGTLTSKPLDNLSGNLIVSFDVKGWSNVEGSINVTLGGATQNYVYTARMSDAFVNAELTFQNVAANSVLIIQTSNGRAFVDNIAVCLAPEPSTSTTWTGTWSNGTPTTALDAVIAGNYNTSTNGAITAKSLTVNSGVFTIASGTSVTVENAVVNSAGVANFIVENNGNLIQNTTATNSGAITVKRNSNPLFRYDYTLWASPVVGQNVKAFSPATLSNRFLVYNTATGANGDYEALFPAQSESTYNFEAGKGYLIRTSDTHPLYVSGNTGTVINAEFKGVPFNQNINVPLSNATTGFNLVGNPYASPISISQLFADNSNAIDGTIWFWRKRNGVAGTGYATSTGLGVTSQHSEATAIDPTGVIGAGQGFFVKVKSGATQNALNLSNALRSTNTGGSFFRNYAADTERHRIWLNISNENGIVGQTLLGYMEGATQGVDYGIEGKYFNDSPIAFCSFVDNQEFAIQGRSLPFEVTDVVPMSFKTDVAGNFTISVADFDGLFAQGQEIYIKDKFTGQVHDIKSSSYTFATETGVFNNRFEVVYQSLLSVGTPNVDSSAIVVYKQNGSLVVNAGQYEIATIEVYDMSGRLVFKKSNVNASDCSTGSLSVANQVLVVKVTTAENGTVNKKVVY